MVTLSSCLIWQIINFILPPNEYDCVYAWTTLWNIAIDRLREDADFGKNKIIFSDETHFDLGGYVNKQNCRIWDTEFPQAYIEKPTHPKRVTVWCGFWSGGLIEPFFFENEQGEAATVNGDHYRGMLNVFLFTKIEKEDIGNIWFQQDGATSHTAELHSYTRCFAPCFWRSQSWYHLATSELRFDTVGLLFCGVPSKISIMPISQRQLML